MKKIVHILLGKANPERMNGVNKIVHQMASAQVEQGYDVEVIGLTKNISVIDNRPYKLTLIKQNPHNFITNTLLKHTIDRMDKHTIVHFHGVLIPIFYTIASKLKSRGIPYVVTPHGALQPLALNKNRFLKSIYFYLFEKSFLNNAFKLQAITNYEKSILEKLVSTNITTIPNAYPFQAIDLKKLQNNQTIFCYIGRLSKDHKGLDALIDGFDQFCQKNDKGLLWLIGDGPDRHSLQLLSKNNRIHFKGEVHGDDKNDLLHQADVFIHPSRWDVLPTAILEAAAFGKPLIITKATSFAESVNDWQAGIVLEKAEPNLIAKAMQDISSNSLQETGKNAQNMVKEQYNWSKVIHNILSDLYAL